MNCLKVVAMVSDHEDQPIIGTIAIGLQHCRDRFGNCFAGPHVSTTLPGA